MARGILVELLSRPDGWETTADDMWRESVKRHGKESPGRRAFRGAFAELKHWGYLSSERAALDSGKHGTLLTVRDISAGATDVPHAGTSASPVKTDIPAGRTDVPDAGTSASPAEMDETAGGTDVPRAGTSKRKRSPKKTGEEKKTVGVDAVGQGAGGFASAGASDSAADESHRADGGSAASKANLPSQRKNSPRPATTRTKPRQQSPGFQLVRDAIPPEVARPGTKLYQGLHRAIEDLLTGAPGIPARTPEQVIARINRRWYGENADERSAADYRGCGRCTASGCEAARHGLENPDGCKRIKNRNSWLRTAILAQDCPDAFCEDGWLIGSDDRCQVCLDRAAEQRAVERAAAAAAARWEAEIAARNTVSAADAAVAAWSKAEAAEEHRVRQILAEAGTYGVLLDHRVHQQMTGWRDRHPKPPGSHTPAARQAPVQGAFLLSMPGTPETPATAPHAATTNGLKAVSNG